MALHKEQKKQVKSNQKLCYTIRVDNFTFLKSNYKYKRRVKQRIEKHNNFNRCKIATTEPTYIAITQECNSINKLINNDTIVDSDKWQTRAYNVYAMIFRMLLLIISNMKLRLHRKMMHHITKGKLTIDDMSEFINGQDNAATFADRQPAMTADLLGTSNNDVNINSDFHKSVVKVLATPLTSSTNSSSPRSSTTISSLLRPSMASFVLPTTCTPSSSSSLLSLSLSATSTTLSSLLPFSTLCNVARFSDKLFTYMSALFIAFALCARSVAGGACWQAALDNGKCNQIYSLNITRTECCSRSTHFSFTERNPSDVEYFFATAIGGGMECSPCIESCKNVKCTANKKCVKRKGRPKCICAPECGKAARRRRTQLRAKHYRGHLHHNEQIPRNIRSLSSEITNFDLGLVTSGNVVDAVSGRVDASKFENRHINQNQRNSMQNMQSQQKHKNEKEKHHQFKRTKQQTTNFNSHRKKNRHNDCINQNHNSSNINCNFNKRQQERNDDNEIGEQHQSWNRDRHQRRQQRIQRRQRIHHHRQQFQQQQQHHHQHQHRHHSKQKLQHVRDQEKEKLKDRHYQQQEDKTTMTMLTLPIKGATSFLPSSSTTSIYNITTTTTKNQPQTTFQSQTSPSSPVQIFSAMNSTTSLPSFVVITADRQHLLNRGSILTMSSLSTTASQPPSAISSSSTASMLLEQNQLPPSSEFFSAISKVPLSSSVVKIPSVAIVGVGTDNTSPVSTSRHVNTDLALFNLPGLANEQNKHLHFDIIPHTTHPVCGTDGRTYNSECQMKKRACRTSNSNLKVAYRGHCKTSCNGVKCLNNLMCVEDHYMVPHCIPCIIQCPQDDDDDDGEQIVNDYERNFTRKTSQQQKSNNQRNGIDPERAVCGVDGKTYKSTCDINRMICKIGRAIAVAYPGPCRADRITCNDINCGSKHKCLVDLLTHEPRCVSCSYKCSRKHHPTALRYENGKVCGVNNRTYNSWCEMRKDSCTTGFFIDVKKAGKCH